LKNILVTGGAGYIGSHTCVELLNSGYDVYVVDNLSNSKETALHRVEEICGRSVKFIKADLLDEAALDQIFRTAGIDAVIHFAGFKAVGESTRIPLEYYHNNIVGSITLFRVMEKYNVKNLVFSSSATVYGNPHKVPIEENSPLSATNPYGRTKLMIEEILKDLYASDNNWRIVILRYFNPVGAHSSGKIGEDPQGIPNNLMPYIAQVAIGKLSHLNIFGHDYPTIDGTGVRDYIHVVDLAIGHIHALQKIAQTSDHFVYNLGTGRGYSVLEVVKAFQQSSKRSIPYKFAERRPGDIAICYANAHLAEMELKWKTERTIEDMCGDMWRWQMTNPNGYDK
jgi:UDP-glucose 4-epimerase